MSALQPVPRPTTWHNATRLNIARGVVHGSGIYIEITGYYNSLEICGMLLLGYDLSKWHEATQLELSWRFTSPAGNY